MSSAIGLPPTMGARAGWSQARSLFPPPALRSSLRTLAPSSPNNFPKTKWQSRCFKTAGQCCRSSVPKSRRAGRKHGATRRGWLRRRHSLHRACTQLNSSRLQLHPCETLALNRHPANRPGRRSTGSHPLGDCSPRRRRSALARSASTHPNRVQLDRRYSVRRDGMYWH